MLGKLFTLIGLWAIATGLWAISEVELVENLHSRMHPLPNKKGKLIKSFTNHSQSYIYDQALAIMAFTHAFDKKSATELLTGLSSLQHKDGSFYYSYYLDGKSPYPSEGGDKRLAGAISWVSLAATYYQKVFGSKDFFKLNKKILDYLDSQIKEVKGMRALAFNHTDLSTTSWDETQTAALEHNLDAYAAFLNFSQLNGQKKWKKNIHDLNTFILSMWDNSRSHFWSGMNLKNGRINKDEIYLDNQSWSLLALDPKSIKKLDSTEALQFNCENLYVEKKGIKGFMDTKPSRMPASSQYIWSEGTIGQALAMRKLGNRKCRDLGPQDFLNSIKKMKKEDGGIAYSTKTPNPDFTTASSVAGTAWLYFALAEFNPFQLK